MTIKPNHDRTKTNIHPHNTNANSKRQLLNPTENKPNIDDKASPPTPIRLPKSHHFLNRNDNNPARTLSIFGNGHANPLLKAHADHYIRGRRVSNIRNAIPIDTMGCCSFEVSVGITWGWNNAWPPPRNVIDFTPMFRVVTFRWWKWRVFFVVLCNVMGYERNMCVICGNVDIFDGERALVAERIMWSNREWNYNI